MSKEYREGFERGKSDKAKGVLKVLGALANPYEDDRKKRNEWDRGYTDGYDKFYLN